MDDRWIRLSEAEFHEIFQLTLGLKDTEVEWCLYNFALDKDEED